MEKPERIIVDPNLCLSQPTIRGLRITVSFIQKILANGATLKEVLDGYTELEAEDV